MEGIRCGKDAVRGAVLNLNRIQLHFMGDLRI